MHLFKTLFLASIKSQAQYKVDFIVNIIGNFLGLFGDFLVIFIILYKFNNVEGWNIYEIAILYGIIEVGFGIYRLIGEGINKFEEMVISGKLDTLFIRPASILLQVFLQKFDFKRIGMLAQATLVLTWGIINCESIDHIFLMYLPIMIITSALVNISVSVTLSALAFWTGKNKDIIILGHYSTRSASVYPATIFHKPFIFILTFIIPFFSVCYYPMQYLTSRSDNPLYLLAPFMGVTILIPITILVWSSGVRRYSSSGT